ncbi:hypothetical protein SCLCIDRAFT_122229, partial [Scleroderma citrinum Foug A]
FSPNTSTTLLCNHLESIHTLQYMVQLQEQGWVVQTKLLKAAFSGGYTYDSLKATLVLPNMTIDALPPPPLHEVGDMIPLCLGPKTDLGTDIPEFSLTALHDYLVRFIVADDQVHAM